MELIHGYAGLRLLIYLMRLSSPTVDIALRLGTVPRVADFVINAEGADGVAIHLMCRPTLDMLDLQHSPFIILTIDMNIHSYNHRMF